MKKSLLDEKLLAFCDLETTGLHPDINEIISIAGQKYTRAGELVEEIEFKIQFNHITEPPPYAGAVWPGPKPFSVEDWKEGVDFALKLNGYREEDWENAIPLREAIKRIMTFLNGCVIVGHNPHFDREFIATKAKRLGFKDKLPYHKIDTVTLAYEHLAPLGLGYLSLSRPGGVCDFLGIPITQAHEALDDVRRTAQAFFKMDRATWAQRLWWALRWNMKHRQ